MTFKNDFEYGSMLGPDGKNKWKCPKHPKIWLKKGHCSVCWLEAKEMQRKLEEMGGSNHPPVKIGTTDDLNKEPPT